MYFLRLYLWAAPNILCGVCAAALVRRRSVSTFPFFFSYLVYQAADFLTLVVVSRLVAHGIASLTTYRWILVGFDGPAALLQIATLYEVANQLVLSRSSLVGPLRLLLRWSLALLLLAAIVSSAILHQPALGRVIAAVQTLEFCGSLISVGLVLALLVFSNALRVSWRGLAPGVAVGFALKGSLDLVVAALISVIGSQGNTAFIHLDIIRMAALHLAVVVWLVYLFRPAAAPSYPKTRLNKAELQSWNDEFQRIGRQ